MALGHISPPPRITSQEASALSKEIERAESQCAANEAAPLRFRGLYFALGWFFFGLGAVGAVLPLLPTTPFMLLAAWAFSKSSRRFELWLLNNRWFGPSIRRFRENRIVSRKAKLLAWGTMGTTFLATLLFTSAPWWGLAGQVVLMGIGAFVVGRFPSTAAEAESRQRRIASLT